MQKSHEFVCSKFIYTITTAPSILKPSYRTCIFPSCTQLMPIWGERRRTWGWARSLTRRKEAGSTDRPNLKSLMLKLASRVTSKSIDILTFKILVIYSIMIFQWGLLITTWAMVLPVSTTWGILKWSNRSKFLVKTKIIRDNWQQDNHFETWMRI
jgi:hypothetical protein